MTLSPAMLGAIAGAVLGLIGFISLRTIAHRVETMKGGNDPKTAANILRIAALGDLIIFPVVGFFIGPMLFN